MSASSSPNFWERIFPHRPGPGRITFDVALPDGSYTYEIRVDVPEGASGPLPALLYLDANLPSGRPFFQEAGKMMTTGEIPPLLLVGIAQPRKPLTRRNTDFIPGRKESVFGEGQEPSGARRFYQFIVHGLLPALQKEFELSGEYGLAGHSFGGLFTLYAMYQPERPFSKYLALSPSVWVHRRHLIELAIELQWEHARPQGAAYFASGALEKFNLVLDSMKAFSRELKLRELEGLDFKEEVIPWKNHFTIVRPGVKRGLEFLYGTR